MNLMINTFIVDLYWVYIMLKVNNVKKHVNMCIQMYLIFKKISFSHQKHI